MRSRCRILSSNSVGHSNVCRVNECIPGFPCSHIHNSIHIVICVCVCARVRACTCICVRAFPALFSLLSRSLALTLALLSFSLARCACLCTYVCSKKLYLAPTPHGHVNVYYLAHCAPQSSTRLSLVPLAPQHGCSPRSPSGCRFRLSCFLTAIAGLYAGRAWHPHARLACMAPGGIRGGCMERTPTAHARALFPGPLFSTTPAFLLAHSEPWAFASVRSLLSQPGGPVL